MAAYYNEIDKFAAAWLRELIKAGLIADGEVDERSIELVRPDDLRGFRQCHFFAGIGGWSYALRLAGWPDDRDVWTGSCPCQPFSSAGAQAGGHDPRDLWPVWFQLIAQCRPVVVFGEQVEAAIGHGWLDRLCDDLEAEDYAVGACGLPGACVGAFDIRQRLWFVAESDGRQQSQERSGDEPRRQQSTRRRTAERAGTRTTSGIGDRCGCWDPNAFHRTIGMLPGEVCVNAGRLADPEAVGLRQGRADASWRDEGTGAQRAGIGSADVGGSRMGYATSDGREARQQPNRACVSATGREGRLEQSGIGADCALAHADRAGLSELDWRRNEPTRSPAASFWRDADWLPCSDGKARPVEPGTFPLAHGVSARVGRLRGYGNAIKPQVAQVFIEAYLDSVR